MTLQLVRIELDCVVLHDENGVMDDVVFVPRRTVDDDEE